MAEHARSQWLRHTLVLDNQIFLERDPELAGGKLAKMGERPYRFFRGTAPQYARDAMQPGSPGYQPSAFGSERTRDVALVGDPHPENIGTFRREDGTIVVDFNDFDASTHGPYELDLRRLALGFFIAGEQILRDHADLVASGEPVDATLMPDDRIAAARAVAAGYVAEIERMADAPGEGLVVTDANVEQVGVVLASLVEAAREDGEAQEKLVEYTVVEEGRRSMFFGDVEPPMTVAYGEVTQAVFQDTVQPIGARERELVEGLLGRYPESRITPVDPAALRIKGVSRRLGAGVSSYPVDRFYVLVEGPSEAVEDDVLLELKQVFDAVPTPGLVRYPSQPYSSNAERVVAFQRQLQSFDDDDPWLGWALAGADAYRIRWRTGYQRGVRVVGLATEMAEGDVLPEDFVALAEAAGRMLAGSHGRAPKADGEPGAPAIAAAIGEDGPGLVDEVVAFVELYGPRVLADHVALQDLIETHGSRLGYRRR